jgi:hypothetical protein
MTAGDPKPPRSPHVPNNWFEPKAKLTFRFATDCFAPNSDF